MALETGNVSAGKNWLGNMRKRIGGAVMALTMAVSPTSVNASSVCTMDDLIGTVAKGLGISPHQAAELISHSGVTEETKIAEIGRQLVSSSGQKSFVVVTQRGEKIVIQEGDKI